MKKKALALLVLFTLVFSMILTGCNSKKDDTPDDNQGNQENNGENSSNENKSSYKTYSFEYFDTVTTIIGYETTGEKFGEVSKVALSLLGEYHKLFDIYNEYEGINNICTINKLVNGEHQVVKVDRKIIDMLLLAKEMYTLTDGKMNIAMGSVLSIWHDYRTAGIDNPVKAELPPMEKLTEASKHIDINNIIIDEKNSTVWLADPQMKLDVGAFAKGYAVEMVAQRLKEMGKTDYVLNVGGNIRTLGTKATGAKWKTGIENPADTSEYIEYIELAGESIVTSGSYQRFYVVGGKRYHHIIDSETLMPATGLLSVSIVCESSALGDALSTALFCMSVDEGMALVNSLNGVEAMWVTEDEVVHYSNNFAKFKV